jgi:hypothetical protein
MFLKVLAKAHVEHFVGFVEHHDFQRGEVERAAFQVIAQAPRRADDDMGAVCSARRSGPGPCRRRTSRCARRHNDRARPARG